MVVLFPAPLGPRNPNTSPFCTLRCRSRTAHRRLYRFASPLVRRTGAVIHEVALCSQLVRLTLGMDLPIFREE